jgi:hypothetical protein
MFVIAAPMLFYFFPATIPIWKPFLIVWTGLGLVLAYYWLSGFYSQAGPRGLADAIDLFVRIMLTSCWLTAGFVQYVRGKAFERADEGYRHWLMVVFGACFVIVATMLTAAAI